MPDTAAALVLNLFTFAGMPEEFFDNWINRDCSAFQITPFLTMPINAVVFAYGDAGQDPKEPERHEKCSKIVRARIAELHSAFGVFPMVALPTILNTKLKNPKHPKHWKTLKQIPSVKEQITNCLRRSP